MIKPRANKTIGSEVRRTDPESQQQYARAQRPQVPQDATTGGRPYHQSGQMPKGGFTSIWCFDGSTDTRKSSTTRPGKKVY